MLQGFYSRCLWRQEADCTTGCRRTACRLSAWRQQTNIAHQWRLHRPSELAQKPSGCFTSASLLQGYTLMESFALSVLLGLTLETADHWCLDEGKAAQRASINVGDLHLALISWAVWFNNEANVMWITDKDPERLNIILIICRPGGFWWYCKWSLTWPCGFWNGYLYLFHIFTPITVLNESCTCAQTQTGP